MSKYSRQDMCKHFLILGCVMHLPMYMPKPGILLILTASLHSFTLHVYICYTTHMYCSINFILLLFPLALVCKICIKSSIHCHYSGKSSCHCHLHFVCLIPKFLIWCSKADTLFHDLILPQDHSSILMVLKYDLKATGQ